MQIAENAKIPGRTKGAGEQPALFVCEQRLLSQCFILAVCVK